MTKPINERRHNITFCIDATRILEAAEVINYLTTLPAAYMVTHIATESNEEEWTCRVTYQENNAYHVSDLVVYRDVVGTCTVMNEQRIY